MGVTIFEVKGVIKDSGTLREGKTKKGDDYAARTIQLDPQDGSMNPLVFDYYRQGDKTNWVKDFSFTEGDLVSVQFTIRVSYYTNRNGDSMPITNLGVWKVQNLNQSGRVSPKKPVEEAEEEDDLPF